MKLVFKFLLIFIIPILLIGCGQEKANPLPKNSGAKVENKQTDSDDSIEKNAPNGEEKEKSPEPETPKVDPELKIKLTFELGQAIVDYGYSSGEFDEIRRLIAEGADVNGRRWGRIPFVEMCIEKDDSAVLELLLENGANPNVVGKDGNTPLFQAVKFYNTKSVELLFAHGLELIPQDGVRSLLQASFNGSLEIVRILLDRGVQVDGFIDPSTSDKAYDKLKKGDGIFDGLLGIFSPGRTPLMNSTAMGHVDVMKLLIDRGANIRATEQDERGWSPIFWALNTSSLEEKFHILVRAGADIFVLDKWNYTTLMVATGFANVGAVQYLVEHGVDVNAIGKDGHSALSLIQQKIKK